MAKHLGAKAPPGREIDAAGQRSALFSRATESASSASNCSGVGSHAPVVFQMFATALLSLAPVIRPTSQNR